MTTEQSEAGRCSKCRHKLSAKEWDMASEVDGKNLCDDCYDEWADQPPNLPEQCAVTGLAEASREELEKSYELCSWALTRLMQHQGLTTIILHPAEDAGMFKLWYAATPDGGLAVELREHQG